MANERQNDHDLLLPREPENVSNTISANELNFEEQPKDKWYLCHFAFFIIGLCQLLPWNFLLNATNYWMYKFDNRNNNNHTNDLKDFTQFFSKILYRTDAFLDADRTYLQIVFESYLAIASNAPFLLVFCISFSNTFKKIDDKIKNTVLFVSMLIVFIPITAFVLIDTDKFQSVFLYITLVLVFFLNMLSITVQANFAGLASLLPNSIMHIMVTGQAVSGMFSVIAQIIILLGNWSIIQSTFIYFSFACVVILFTLVIYLLTNKTEYFQFYNALHSLPSRENENIDLKDDYKIVFSRMWPYCIALMMNFIVTLSLIPAVLVLAVPDSSKSVWNQKFFIPIACFLVFASGDFLGRYLGGFILLPRKRSETLVGLSFVRIALIPLLMHCNLLPRHYMAVWFPSEVVYIILNMILGLSNGYIALNVFVNGPLSVPVEQRKLSGFFLMLFLGLGLIFGSLASTFLVRIL